MANKICDLLGIRLPVIQAGMVWCSGWRLASAVSNAGGLGLLGAGSMYPEVLREHIKKTREATSFPFGVNLPLLYPDIETLINIIIEEKVPIVFTSAGNPKAWTDTLKKQGIKVVHVVSSLKFALKSQEAGVDAVVAEGFEAGGHNGRDETTTFNLIPLVNKHLSIPLIAAGGIGTGGQVLAAMALGADGVQIGSAFAVSEESSAHIEYKKAVIQSGEGDTVLTLKELTPVRLIKNKFYQKILEAESFGAKVEDLRALLGKGRAKKGIFEGNLDEGELEIGQVSALLNEIKPASKILEDIWKEYTDCKNALSRMP